MQCDFINVLFLKHFRIYLTAWIHWVVKKKIISPCLLHASKELATNHRAKRLFLFRSHCLWSWSIALFQEYWPHMGIWVPIKGSVWYKSLTTMMCSFRRCNISSLWSVSTIVCFLWLWIIQSSFEPLLSDYVPSALGGFSQVITCG